MKAVLEFTKVRDEGEIFYRYDIDGTKVWFDQYQSHGHIYIVAVRPNDELEGIKFYVQDGSNYEVYYPQYVKIDVSHEEFNIDSIDDYIEKLKYAKEVAKIIEDIFNLGIHRECYDKINNI